MRFMTIVAAGVALAAASAAAEHAPPAPVPPRKPALRLDQPGALEQLAARNPEHHRRAVEIIRVAQTMPCGLKLREQLKVHDATVTMCDAALLLTSYPAKRDVAFAIEDQPYALRVTLLADGELLPARR